MTASLTSAVFERVMSDFDHATDEDHARAKALAEQAGWRQRGFLYSHPTRGNYRVSDMDGWIDLCDNEGIEWEGRDEVREATHD